ncbi:pneumococcal serine-rich repeat protein-like [Littorina saxatilis]|uniref:pneumococcal serine-rich repeat protein-like n=1 Tax=Littorina saxatilis TaxID=31220 RepID=UPI0038B4A4B9
MGEDVNLGPQTNMAEPETYGATSPRAGGERRNPFHHHHHHFPTPSLNPATEAFSSAITQMYLGRSANPLLLRHGLNGPISTEHLRSRTSSVSSQATRRGPLRADHNLQTPRSANDREIEEINRQAEAVERARQRNPKPRPQRPLSAQLHPTYFTDVADDTDPTSLSDISRDVNVPRPHSARRRVYLIKRPQSAPVYADVMDGSLTARSQKSETSQQNAAQSEVVASSISDSVTSATVGGVSHSSKQTLTSISKQKTMEVLESQTTSSSVLKTESSSASKTESSDSSLSLLPAQPLGRGNASAGAYENTRVASNSHVTRRQMITIQGSALNSYDKSIMLNDSGFPEELSSTFKAKPVMVRERKVSPLSPHGPKESQGRLSSFGRQGSNSSSSLSLVEIDPSGAMRLSPKHGSREDLDLFSKASKIVHAQRSEDTLENDVSNDDDHELVVIREYVFAARKHGPGDSTLTTPRVEITSSETNTISSTTVQSSVHSTLETRGRESSTTLHSSFRSSRKANDEEEELSQVSSTSALKEDDSGLDSPPSMQDVLPLPPTKPKRTGRASREIDVTEVSHLRSKPNEEMTANDDTMLTKKQQQSVLTPGAKPGSKGDSHDDDSTESQKTQSPGVLEKYGVTVNVSSSPLDAAVAAAGSRLTQEKEQSADVGDKTKSIDSQKDTKQDLTSTGFKLSETTSNKANLDQEEIIVADAVKSSLFRAAASADKSTKDEEHLITVESDSKPVHAVTVKSKEAEDQTENSPGHSGPEAFVNRLFKHQQAIKRKVKTAEATSLGSADGKPDQDIAEASVPDNMSKQTAGSAPAENFNPAPPMGEKDQTEDAISKELSLTPSSVTDIYASPQKKQKEKDNEVSSSPDMLAAKSTKDLPGEERKDVPAQDDKKVDVSVTEFAAAAVSALYAVPQKKQKESTQPDSTSADSDSQSSLGPMYATPDKKRKFGIQRGTHQDLSQDDVSRTSEKDAVVESGINDKKNASDLHLSADLTKTLHLDANGDVEAKENIPKDEIKMSSAATVMAQKQPPKHHTGQDDKGDEPQGKAADKDSEGNNDTTQEITGAALEAARKFQGAGTTDEKNVLHAANSAECSKSPSRLNRQRDSLTEEEYHKPWSNDFSSLEDDIRSKIASAFPSAEEGQENEYEQPLTEDKPASESAVKATAASPNHYAMKELNRLSQGETITDNMNLPGETSHPTADPAQNPDAADSQSSSKAGTDAMNVYSEVHCGPEGEKATENIAALVSAVPTISTTPTTARKISGNRLDRPPLPRTPSPGTRKISDTRLDRPPLPRTPSPSATRKISDTSSNRSPVLMSRSPAALRTISDNGLDRPPLPLTPAPPATRKISDNRLDKPALPMAPSPSATRKMSDDQSNRSPAAPKKMTDNRTDRPTLPTPPLPPVANKSQKEESPVKLAGAKDEEAKTFQNEKVQDQKEEDEAKPGPEVKADGAKPPTKEKPSKSGSEEKTSPHHQNNKLKEKFKKVFSHSSEDKKAAKADNKKGSPSTQKKEMKGAAPEEDKPTKLGEKKKDKNTPTSEEKRPSPAIAIKDQSEALDENNTSQTEPATQSKNSATEDEVRNKDPNKGKEESTEEKSGEDKGDDKETDAQQSQPLSLQEYQYNVKLPLPPSEAKKLIKAEKKHAAKAHREEAKGAVPKEDQKISSPKAPHKAFKWFKKKLGNREKKAPKTKKYSINAAGEEDEAEHEGDGDAEEKLTGRVAPNSDSDASHDSSNSSSESDNESNEGEKKKPKKKLPFWKGKKDKKKKAAENESDSDTSAEESKSKLFSWSLGRKKDTSDQEDNLPAGSKKNADWTHGEDTSGVSGTFRKISDNVTQSQPQPSNELTKKNAKEGQTSKEQDGPKEASLSKSNAGPPLKSKPKPERTTKSKPEADSKDQEAQPAHQKPNNAVKESVAEKVEDAIKNSHPDASVRSSEKPSSNARSKLFVIGDSEGLKGKARDIGENTMLRQDATLTQKDAARSPKLPKNSGYELARPLFLEDDGDKANCVLSNKEKTSEDDTAMSAQVDRLENLVKAEATDLKKVNGEPQHEAAEDIIIPVKADRPVHQALKLLEKSSNEDPRAEKSDIPDKRVGDAKSSVSKANPGQSEKIMYPPSPVLGPKMDKPPVSVKPRPKLRKEEAVRDPAVEEEIIPSKAEEESRGQRLSTNLAFKAKTPKPDTRDDTNNKVTKDPKNVDVDTNTLTGAKEKVHGAASEVTNPSSSDVDTPRSNTDSIGSPGRTYIDGSDFLDTAKASWGLQENNSTVSKQEQSPKSSPSMTNANRKNAAGFASLLNESKKVKAEFKEAGKSNSTEHPPDADSCKPSELACSLASKSIVDDKINPETTSTVQSPPYPISQSTNASSSSPRGLDSQDSKPVNKNIDPPKTSPTKPAISAKKPDVRPKLFAKPKISRPRGEKGDTDDLEKKPELVPAENTSKTEKSASTQSASPSTEINSSIKPGEQMSAKKETLSLDVDPAIKSTVAANTAKSPRREDGSGDTAAVRGKPLPPERSKTADKADADDESTELQNPTISSPAPKPRISVKGLKDRPAGVFLKNTIPANSETENQNQERPTTQSSLARKRQAEKQRMY